MYTPATDMAKLGARFNAQARARNADWLGKPGQLTVWGSKKEKLRMLKIIARAKKSSTVARQAIAWARAHNLVFTIEPEQKNIAGQYSRGVVSLCLAKDSSNDYFNADRLTRTLVHEIRHAWQDYYGLLSLDRHGGDVRTTDQIIVNALYEADAMAVGDLAYKECVRTRGVSNYPAALRLEFMRWFNHHATAYHQRAVENISFAKNPVVKAITTCFGVFSRKPSLPIGASVDWQLYLSKLGRTFDGFDYLASGGPKWRDQILRDILSPSRAIKQFGTRRKIESNAQELDIADRKQRLKHQRALRLAKSPRTS